MKGDRVLIVDDEADIALILKLKLEDAGYRTARARDGVEALDMLRSDDYALMLLDIRMPRLDGLQVLERVEAEGSDVAVVMMTAHGSEDIAVDAMKMGAVDYVAKPFSTDDLLKKVDKALEYRRAQLENQRLHREIDEERRKLKAILEGMAELLVAVDVEGRVLTINRQAEDLLGVSNAQVLGKPLGEVLEGDIPTERLPSLQVLASGKPLLDLSYQLRTKNGLIPVLASATPLSSDDGRLTGAVEIIRDISSLKALEQEREDFVSMLSHDLKSPLTAIVGSIDLVREGRLGPLTPQQREYLDAAVESSNEAVEMINTLLDVHKFEAGKMTLLFRDQSLNEVVSRRLTSLEPLARRENLSLESRLEAKVPSLQLDGRSVARVLGNLIGNAVKFTPSGGTIEVATTLLEDPSIWQKRLPVGLYPESKLPKRGAYVALTVRDTGVGIAPQDLAAIFDRFVQARNRKLGKTSGTGLGLTFCRKVMDAHGGFIWAESSGSKGSTFSLLFPVRHDTVSANATTSRSVN
jgi:PAS domain S-box-containing protein